MTDMTNKITAMKKRRAWVSWDTSNPSYRSATNGIDTNDNRPNILFILADDMGYGDLSVDPFVSYTNGIKGSSNLDPNNPCDSTANIYTPNLMMMASKGTILTNFHSASPVCSPSRVAIMTALYPYRLNALNAFELGQYDLTQRNGYLLQFPTGIEILRGTGYYTGIIIIIIITIIIIINVITTVITIIIITIITIITIIIIIIIIITTIIITIIIITTPHHHSPHL